MPLGESQGSSQHGVTTCCRTIQSHMTRSTMSAVSMVGPLGESHSGNPSQILAGAPKNILSPNTTPFGRQRHASTVTYMLVAFITHALLELTTFRVDLGSKLNMRTLIMYRSMVLWGKQFSTRGCLLMTRIAPL